MVDEPLVSAATVDYTERARVNWLSRVWRAVAADYCEHEGVGKSCSRCRGLVADIADAFIGRASD